MRVFVRLGLMALVSLAGSLVSAQSVVATQQNTQQTALISGSYKNAELRVVLEDIAAKGNYKLWYTPAEPALRERVTITVANVPVSVAFAQVLKGTGVTTTLSEDGKTVLVVKAVAKGTKAIGVITGKVTDSKTGKGITGATISLDTDARGIHTDENGLYRLTSVAVGNHTVTVRLVGYAKQARQVVVGEGTTIAVDFKLEPSTNVLDQVVVTGTVIASELKSVPNAITVITAKQIEERGITRIDQLFRGDVPGVFAQNLGSFSAVDSTGIFSRGTTKFQPVGESEAASNPIKVYVDGIEMVNSSYLSQIDPRSIERIEILTGPQGSTIYGSNAINGVMQIFTKRGNTSRPQLYAILQSGIVQNSYSTSLSPIHSYSGLISGIENRWSYQVGSGIDYVGAWTPAKRTIRVSSDGSGRIQFSKLTLDGSARHSITRNRRDGDVNQGQNEARASGLYAPVSNNGTSMGVLMTTLNGNTLGMTAGYTPFSWWSHEVTVGHDQVGNEFTKDIPSYSSTLLSPGADSLLQLNNTSSSRSSERYTTTSRFPLSQDIQLTIVGGADHWSTASSSIASQPVSLAGVLISSSTIRVSRGKPGKNTGGFLQSQLDIKDALFITYGIRAEWNPNFGDNAQPNMSPRYGIAYTGSIGPVTAKLRGSYGRSTRPPIEELKQSVAATGSTQLALFGPYDSRLANFDLGPEFQQGGEGGVEFYLGNRASLVITRYNQTVDGLVTFINADSVQSLQQNPGPVNGFQCAVQSDGYCYQVVQRYVNVGSIRNQGWEFQGSMTAGPLTTRGVYSWTKSRVIGITPRYRAQLSDTQYQPGYTFTFLPEHTWALNIGYTRSTTSVTVNVNGTGFSYRTTSGDELYYQVAGQGATTRLRTRSPRFTLPATFRSTGPGYAITDLNISHRLLQSVDGMLQIQNLGNFYQNDFGAQYAVIGRQSKFGLRIKM